MAYPTQPPEFNPRAPEHGEVDALRQIARQGLDESRQQMGLPPATEADYQAAEKLFLDCIEFVEPVEPPGGWLSI